MTYGIKGTRLYGESPDPPPRCSCLNLNRPSSQSEAGLGVQLDAHGREKTCFHSTRCGTHAVVIDVSAPLCREQFRAVGSGGVRRTALLQCLPRLLWRENRAVNRRSIRHRHHNQPTAQSSPYNGEFRPRRQSP